MTIKTWKTPLNHNELAVHKQILPELSEKLFTDVEKAKTILVHFDHIQGESENDRDQIFSNLLKAAVYFGLNVEKVDFHRLDN